jgi:SAM-dependent methyltransferase
MLNKYYPEREDVFHKLLLRYIHGCEQVLDAGCGDGSIFTYDFRERVDLLVGLDLRQDLAANSQVRCATRGSVECLPFRNNAFDLIFSRFVLEHIREPENAFVELSRVLQPGGKLIILVPNAYHYFVIAGRIIPHSLQKRIASWVGYRDEDTFPTYYRANTRKTLTTFAHRAGLGVSEMTLHEPCPWFLSFSPLTLALAILYERIVNRFEALAHFGLTSLPYTPSHD